LPLTRLRAQGQLTELRASDLRFTAEEAEILLHEAVGSHLHDAAVAMLAARTEGWAAGLQLAALSLRDQADVDGFVETFSGTNRYVLDYLTEEVLERQPAPVREFLLETSVLERLSGPLCDAVTDRTDSQAILETIERANLFLVALDEVRGWWRIHHLFADLLRARLGEHRPGRVIELHRNAARWHEEHGLVDDAVRHATAAGDVAWAERLIERHADGLFLRSEGATVQRWLAGLPAEKARSGPRLLLAQAALALLGGRVEEAEGLIDAAERSSADAADEPFEASAGRATSLLANVPATIALQRSILAELRGDAEATAAFASQCLATLSEGDQMLAPHARGHLAVAEWLGGGLADAERGLSSCIEQCQTTGQTTMTAWCCHHLGQVQRAGGRLDAAVRTYQKTLEITAPLGRPALPAAGAAKVGLAEVAYQQNELDTALRHLTEGLALCRQLNFFQPLATGLATLAWIRQAQGDAGGALETIREAERAAPGPAVASLVNPVPTQRARLLLAQGDIAAAARWVKKRAISEDDEPGYPREPEYLLLARVLLAQNRTGPALPLLERLLAAAAAQGRTGSIIEIQALRALALGGEGDEAGVIAALTGALTLAHAPGYVRVFAEEGPTMAALLDMLLGIQPSAEQSAVRDVPVDYLGRLMHSFTQQAAPTGSDAAASTASIPGQVTELSERELDVLRRMAAGEQNQQIGSELYISLNTVKKHITHIFEKLGAANRTQAVARARELGLLP
jgi:LuxR family maltose regulon positive regulatory protein